MNKMNLSMNKISCIIPAYNEEKTIKEVLDIVTNHELIGEVIVINDGSKDNTHNILKEIKGIKLINNATNIGKSASVAKGIKLSKNRIIMLLDADLINLNKEHITNLAKPVLNNEVDMSIGRTKTTEAIYKLNVINKIFEDFASGQRVFNKKIVNNLEELMKIPGYCLEISLNKKVVEYNLKIKIIKWNNVIAISKIEKEGLVSGIKKDLSAIKEIINENGLNDLIYQNYKLKRQIER